MKVPCYILIVFFAGLVTGCKREGRFNYDKGVSLELNEARKRNVDSVQYVIQLDIPPEKSKPIRANRLFLSILNLQIRPWSWILTANLLIYYL